MMRRVMAAPKAIAWTTLLVATAACDVRITDDGDAGLGPRFDAGMLDAAAMDTAVDDTGAGDAGVDAAGFDPACGGGECDLLDPLSCTEPDGCIFLLDSDERAAGQCTEVGDGRDGERCETHLDCGPGLDCTGAGGVCRRYCCEINRVAGCPAGQFCRIGLTEQMGMATDVGLCDRCDGCDLTGAASCGEGLGCYALPGSSPCAACLPAGDVAVDAPCEHTNDCAPGSGCFSVAEGLSRCIPYCSMGSGDACASGTQCRDVAGVALPEAIGLCL